MSISDAVFHPNLTASKSLLLELLQIPIASPARAVIASAVPPCPVPVADVGEYGLFLGKVERSKSS